MPSKRFLEIQKLYVTLGFNALSKTEVTYLLKRLQRADTLLETLLSQGYMEMKNLKEIKEHVKAD